MFPNLCGINVINNQTGFTCLCLTVLPSIVTAATHESFAPMDSRMSHAQAGTTFFACLASLVRKRRRFPFIFILQVFLQAECRHLDVKQTSRAHEALRKGIFGGNCTIQEQLTAHRSHAWITGCKSCKVYIRQASLLSHPPGQRVTRKEVEKLRAWRR